MGTDSKMGPEEAGREGGGGVRACVCVVEEVGQGDAMEPNG